MTGTRIIRRTVLSAAAVLVVALATGVSPSLAARGHVCESSFGEKGSGNGQLERPEGIAVNESTGTVYVVDSLNNRVEYFNSTGAYEGQFNGSGLLLGEGKAAPTGQFSEPQTIAVDNSTSPSDPSRGDVYVVDGEHNLIDKYTATGEYVGQLTGTPNRLFRGIIKGLGAISVAVDSTGQLWVAFPGVEELEGGISRLKQVARFSDATTNVFIEEWIQGVQGSLSPGLAVDSKDDLYFKGKFGIHVEFIEVVDEFSASQALLNEEVGGEVGDWPAVESSTGDVYVGQVGRVSRYSPEGVLLERLGQGRLTDAAGIAVSSVANTVYVADSSADAVEVCTLELPGKPTVEAESVSDVASGSATFAGEVNPRGIASEYRFEYGQCPTLALCSASGYGTSVPVPDGSLGESFEVSPVSVHLQDLQPGTIYHVRLVAHNAKGEVVGHEVTFTTQMTGGPLVLGDGRMWELVTPAPDAHGAKLTPIVETGLEQASAEGGSFAYLAGYPTEPDPRGFGDSEQVLASRGAGGWSSVNIGVSHNAPIGILVGLGREYRFFSEDLGSAVLESFGSFSPPESKGVSEASPEPTERTPYVRDDDTCAQTAATCYAPVVTGKPNEGDVPPNIKFGGSLEKPQGDVNFVGATPDVSHVVVSSGVGLTGGPGLYEWSAALPHSERLELVSVLPENEGGEGSEASLGGDHIARHAISSDGSRIFFTARAPGQEKDHLYMRDTLRRETVRLDIAEGGSFQTASTDGSKVFFTSYALTGTDLYECEIVEVEEAGKEKLKCDLNDLTPVPASGQPGAGEPAEVQGSMPGVSEQDGGYAYFVANGVQAEGASHGDCNGEFSSEGETCNLYVRHEGVTNFIATLSSDDSPDWSPSGRLNTMTSRVSPNGVWLAFMSDMPLTGYDNHDAKSNMLDEEVYLYNAQTRRLVCASCNPTGARPSGIEYSKLTTSNGGLVGGDRVWPVSQWLAANVPGWTPYRTDEALYQSRYLSDSGRLFFNSSDGLVSQDTNGNEDVYEFEPAGVGPGVAACSESSVMFDAAAGGCVGLISSGVGFGQSAFLDASANGSDVFFLTAEKLAAADTGTGLDIYDAHECTSTSPCSPAPVALPPECVSASSCRVAPLSQPEIFGAPASATFSGAGNVSPPGSNPAVKPRSLSRAEKFASALKVCRRKSDKHRVACERQARKHYGVVKLRKARTKRGLK